MAFTFQVRFDRYLTTPAGQDFSDWAEQVIESFTDEFFNNNEEWIMDSSQHNTWLEKLEHRSPADAARIIQRAKSLIPCQK